MVSPSPSSSDDGHLIQVEALSPSSSLSSFSDGSSNASLYLNIVSPPTSALGRFDGRATQSLSRPVHPARSSSSLSAPRLGPDDYPKLKILQDFSYANKVDGGSLEVRLMRDEDLSDAVDLLSQTFADAVWMPANQVRFLRYWVEQYLVRKGDLLPHAAVVVVMYREGGGAPAKLAGMAEISFDGQGTNPSPPTPVPPRADAPYIWNMTVTRNLRRKHIGRHLLQACEELVKKMCGPTKVYLHCRVMDKIPFNLYKKAGYSVVQTDSYWVWLSFQRRKHLMCKNLNGA